MVIKIPPKVNKAMEILRAKGHTAYVVGGAVRDSLLGVESQDWDIATSALPAQTVDAFDGYRVIETGIKHGTVTVLMDGTPLEITTYRIESGYSDNRHPDSVVFTDRIADDLARRDLTVNAIAYSPEAGFVDPYGGIEDIKSGLLRCVGDPDRRFSEDALRIMRVLRFSQTLGFDIEGKTADSVRRSYRLLANISVERILSELLKTLRVCDKEFLLEYADVIFFILPELAPTRDCTQNHERHIYDVWEHTAAAVEAAPEDEEIRLAMLFHDSGKPLCKTTDENGTDHFHSHGKISREIAYATLERLKASARLRDHVCTLVEYHDFMPELISKATYRKYLGLLGEKTIRELFDVRAADISAQNPAFLSEGMAAIALGRARLDEIIAEDSCLRLRDLKINGNDIKALGIEPSPLTGELLSELFGEVLNDKIKNDRQALIARAAELITERRNNGNGKN